MKNARVAGLFAITLLLSAAAPASAAPAPAKPAKAAAAKPAPAKAASSPDSAQEQPKANALQTVTLPGGVTMTQLVYRTVPGFRPLTRDLYQTPGKAVPRPALVFVHGGGWNSGDARHDG